MDWKPAVYSLPALSPIYHTWQVWLLIVSCYVWLCCIISLFCVFTIFWCVVTIVRCGLCGPTSWTGGWLPGQLCPPLLCPRRRAHHPLRMLHRSLKYIYNDKYKDKDKDKDKDRDNYKYTNTSTKTRANSNRSTIFFNLFAIIHATVCPLCQRRLVSVSKKPTCLHAVIRCHQLSSYHSQSSAIICISHTRAQFVNTISIQFKSKQLVGKRR